jgi:hypothetical protein
VFAVALWLVRSQAMVDDVAYMKAMIPHHSIAVLTSVRTGHSGSAPNRNVVSMSGPGRPNAPNHRPKISLIAPPR